MRKTWAVVRKELRQIRRDPLSLLVLAGLPAFLLVVYGFALNFDVRHVALAVQDRDHSAASRDLVAAFVNSTYFDLVAAPEPGQELESLTQSRTAKAILVIPEGFEPRVAVTPGRGEGAPEAVADVFAQAGFVPFASTAEEHDRAMAVTQGLNFITTVAYLAAARQTPGIENFRVPSFERRLEAARKMLTQDRELFQLISEDNPFLQETVRQFTAYLDLAAGGDLDLLSARASWWWRDTA